MGVLLGLLSIAGLSLFLARVLGKSLSLMPFLAVAAGICFFTVAGCFGVLQVAGYLWYVLCAAALVAVFVLQKGHVLKLITPGFVLFVLGSALFMALFLLTKPMFVHWDEFTFWGTAAKITSDNHELFTTATGNLIARSYPPGLMVLSYFMQFFGGFSEPGLLCSYAVLYLAAFCAATALWGKNRTATVVLLAALVLLPILFTPVRGAQNMQWVYATAMADVPMAVMFGGAIAFYYAGGEKNEKLALPFGVILAALCCVKDMGFALALIALFVTGLDAALCERKHLKFWGLSKGKAWFCQVAVQLALVVGAFVLWLMHLKTAPIPVNRYEITSGMNMLDMLITGVQMLFGVGRTEQFGAVLEGMGSALFTKPVSLLGPPTVVLIILLIMAVGTIVLSTKRRRRRVFVFTICMALGFFAFYLFNVFTYALVFSPQEGMALKDYHRYITPYLLGWVMGALVLFTQAATNPKASFYRLRIARLVNACVCAVLIVCVLALGNWRGNFLNVSPSHYSVRRSVQAVVNAANMQESHNVYIVSQGDDGTRFYMFGYEMPAKRALVYSGVQLDAEGNPVSDEAGYPVLAGNVSATLVAEGQEQTRDGGVACDAPTLTKFLWQQGCTHVLLDVIDGYFMSEFGPMFTDELSGWDLEQGERYYRIEWTSGGECVFVPEGGAP